MFLLYLIEISVFVDLPRCKDTLIFRQYDNMIFIEFLDFMTVSIWTRVNLYVFVASGRDRRFHRFQGWVLFW